MCTTKENLQLKGGPPLQFVSTFEPLADVGLSDQGSAIDLRANNLEPFHV